MAPAALHATTSFPSLEEGSTSSLLAPTKELALSSASPLTSTQSETQQPTELELERERRKYKLAGALRIFAQKGFDHYVSGHASVRDPEHLDTFWVNPFGLACGLMTVSDLVRVNSEGKVVEGGKPERRIVTEAGAIIDAGIYAARPDVNAICHAHPPNAVAYSTLGIPFEFITHDSCAFWNDISYYANFGGVVLEREEGANIVRSLGGKKALLLQNHGPLTVGSCIESAVVWILMLERECQIQLLAAPSASARGIKPIPIDKAEGEYTYARLGTEGAGVVFSQPYFQMIEAQCGHEFKH